ncbi:MAG: hypothetical protein HC879_14340 [Leptolyngbyaceae cyanobacterium SL_5_9]|nr:hypothetical protein [Leptolyngbyaceae cyanobacterium SL_5_9]NJO75639.1 hypothetical protein [Leptolyngbyaceae cyanobacterium RM1_406_9]
MQLLLPIRDSILAAQLDESLSWVIRCSVKNRRLAELALFKLSAWSAVPIAPDFLVNPSLSKHTATALQNMGYERLHAVRLFSPSFDSYLVPATIEGLEEFRRYLGAFPLALFAGEIKPDWMWISLESDLYVVAGTKDFIEQLLPWGIKEGFSRFRNYIVNESMPSELKQHLEYISSQLDRYQDANEEEEFYLSPPVMSSST